MTESLEEALNNVFNETIYENGDVKQGISSRYLCRLTMLKLAAGLVTEDDPFVINAKKELAGSYVNYVDMDEDKLAALANNDHQIWATALDQNLKVYMASGHIVNNKNLQPFFANWFKVAMERAVEHSKTIVEEFPSDNWRPARGISAENSNNAVCIINAEVYSHIPTQTLNVDLQYPPMDLVSPMGVKYNDEKDKLRLKTVEIAMTAVRAADSVRVTYDFDRDGWKIEQASIFSWAVDDENRDEGWIEVAFVQAWGSEVECNDTDDNDSPIRVMKI